MTTHDTYTTQEGTVWNMDGATCPRCATESSLTHRHGASGYFNCPECRLTYDEPDFDVAAYITTERDS